jgi:FtsP/CotA-like multicopper oxidase with cupredoxin domain
MNRRNPPERLTRRSFLAGTGVVLGAGALAGWPAIVINGDRSAGASRLSGVRASRGDGWPQPVTRKSVNGQLTTTLRVRDTQTRIGTEPTKALTYEDVYPGPTLEVSPGDRLRVELVNDTNQITNIHTHGLHVSPKSPADNVLLAIGPHDRYQYEYDIPADHPAGTLWYHAHYHPLTDEQVFGGLFGALVVRGQLDELPGVAGHQERVLIVSQIEIKDHAIVDGAASSLADQVTLVNGQYQPTIQIAPGEIQRWRILNASSVFFRLQLDGHVFHTIAIDGNALAAAEPDDVLEIPPGGRFDVLVQAGPARTYELRSLSWKSFGLYYTSGMTPVPQTIVRVVSHGRPASGQGELPTQLLPFHDLRNVPIDRRRVLQIAEREPRGTGQLNKFSYYINGRQFQHGQNPVGETMLLDTTEEWEFVNQTYEPHPIHIHINPFQVVAVNGAPVNELHYRDTAKLPPFGSLTIRHQFLDFTGVFVWHCHILFHEDNGMMQLLEVVATKEELAAADAAANARSVNVAASGDTTRLYCHLPSA